MPTRPLANSGLFNLGPLRCTRIPTIWHTSSTPLFTWQAPSSPSTISCIRLVVIRVALIRVDDHREPIDNAKGNSALPCSSDRLCTSDGSHAAHDVRPGRGQGRRVRELHRGGAAHHRLPQLEVCLAQGIWLRGVANVSFSSSGASSASGP